MKKSNRNLIIFWAIIIWLLFLAGIRGVYCQEKPYVQMIDFEALIKAQYQRDVTKWDELKDCFPVVDSCMVIERKPPYIEYYGKSIVADSIFCCPLCGTFPSEEKQRRYYLNYIPCVKCRIVYEFRRLKLK